MRSQKTTPNRPGASAARRVVAWTYFVALTTLLVIPDPSAILGETIAEEVSMADKLTHMGSYLLLALAMAWAYMNTKASVGRTHLGPIAALVFVHALATELTQLATPSREFEVLDLLAGWLGGGVGVGLCAIAWAVGRRRTKPGAGSAGPAQQPCPGSE